MDSNQHLAAKNNAKTTQKTEAVKPATNSAHHSAPQQAKPFNLKRRKRRSSLAGW